MESIAVLSPYKTRFIKESDSADLVNLFHIARTALSGTSYTKYDRMLWACKEFCKRTQIFLKRRPIKIWTEFYPSSQLPTTSPRE